MASSNKINKEEEDVFQRWYKDFISHKRLNSDPYNPEHYYDYKAYWKSIGEPDPLDHFPDKEILPTSFNLQHLPDIFKLPGHPTFSSESQSYVPGMENYIRVGKWGPNDQFNVLPPVKNLSQDIIQILVGLLNPQIVRNARLNR